MQKIDMVKRTEAVSRAYDERIIRVTVAMMDALNLTQVVTSEGSILRDTRPMFRMNVHCVSQEADNIQNGSSGIGGRVGLDFLKQKDHAVNLGKQAASEAILLLGAKQAPSGLMPVILGPAQSGILLHEAVGHPLEADFNRKGTSAYSGRIGEKVASDLCSIYDSGTIPHERGAINFDDEGVPSEENIMIPVWAVNIDDWEKRLKWIYKIIPEANELKDRPSTSLSGGQQKLIALSRALMVGKKSISYLPKNFNPEIVTQLPLDISYRFCKMDEVIQFIEEKLIC